MEALDGNAIAAPLFEYFGTEMTVAHGVCASCGTASQIGQLRVYRQAPGAVARCRTCGNVTIVLVNAPDGIRVHLSGFRLGPTVSTEPVGGWPRT